MPRKTIEGRREYMRKWREANPDKVLANDVRDRERQRQYRQAHLEQYAGYSRKRRAEKPQEHLLLQAKTRSKRDGLVFAITEKDVDFPTHCPVLGIELVYVKVGQKERNNSATLDRRDNLKGYIVGNVFVISHRANRVKSDCTAQELQAIATYAAGGTNGA